MTSSPEKRTMKIKKKHAHTHCRRIIKIGCISVAWGRESTEFEPFLRQAMAPTILKTEYIEKYEFGEKAQTIYRSTYAASF